MANTQVRGLKELSKKLEKLPNNLRKKAVRRSIAAGTKIISKEAKANAPRRTGATRRAISVRGISSRRNRNLIRSGIFVRHGKARTKSAAAKGDDPFYWYFIEKGFHTRGPKGSKGRKIPGKRFIERAITSRKGRAIATVRKTLKKELKEYVG